jgi:hypothetical protein
VAAVKDRVGSGGFLVLAPGATPRKWPLSFTIIGVPAFAADKTIFPLLLCYECKALVLIGENTGKRLDIQFFKEYGSCLRHIRSHFFDKIIKKVILKRFN